MIKLKSLIDEVIYAGIVDLHDLTTFHNIAGENLTVLNENMFPPEFDRHKLGSCMSAAALATDYLLSKGIENFKIVEGWVTFDGDYEVYNNKPYGNVASHTWIEFDNGKIFDPTKNQWKKWGYKPDEVEYIKNIKNKTYTPKQYQNVCRRQPDDISKFNKNLHENINNLITIYRGISVYNKDGNYYTTDPEWARNFTQSGQDKEILQVQIDPSVIYKKESLPQATRDDEMNSTIEEADRLGYKAIWVNEGMNEPNSIYVIKNGVGLKNPKKYNSN